LAVLLERPVSFVVCGERQKSRAAELIGGGGDLEQGAYMKFKNITATVAMVALLCGGGAAHAQTMSGKGESAAGCEYRCHHDARRAT
jgi:hypothetical protein